MKYQLGMLDAPVEADRLWDERLPLYFDGVGLVGDRPTAEGDTSSWAETPSHRHRVMRPTQFHRPMPVHCTSY